MRIKDVFVGCFENTYNIRNSASGIIHKVSNFGNFETICGIPIDGLEIGGIELGVNTEEKATCLRCRLLIAAEEKLRRKEKEEALQEALFPMKKVKNLATGTIHMVPRNQTFDEHGKWTLCGHHSFNLIHVRDREVTCEKCLKRLEKTGAIDRSKFYVLFIWGGVDPSLKGPFPTKELRDNESRRLKTKHGDEHGIYPLNVGEDGVPKIGAYSNIFLS